MSPSFTLHRAAFFAVSLHSWPTLWGGAVYMLGRGELDGSATILYIGQTGELRGYIGHGHHKWRDASLAGMNVLLVHWQSDQAKRLNLETILRHQFRPPLNDQLKPNSPAPFGGPGLPAYNAGAVSGNGMSSGLLPRRW